MSWQWIWEFHVAKGHLRVIESTQISLTICKTFKCDSEVQMSNSDSEDLTKEVKFYQLNDPTASNIALSQCGPNLRCWDIYLHNLLNSEQKQKWTNTSVES